MKSILIVAPHPDDETLGCGGTILKYISSGSKVYWLICTEYYRHGKNSENIKIRNDEIEKVSQLYGFHKRFELGFDAASISFSDLGNMISKISKILIEIQPEAIFLPNRSDVHTDHQIIFKAAFSCTKNFNYPFIRKVLMYETMSETEFAPSVAENYFIPNVYIDVSEFFEKKLEIMNLYTTEVMPQFLPRALSSIQALGSYRGSSIGKQYAEAFMMLKEIIT